MKSKKKYINIKEAGLYDPKAGTRDADVTIKNSVLKKLRKDLKVAIEALEFMTMPITTAKKNLTVDRLLATIKEDQAEGIRALNEIDKGL